MKGQGCFWFSYMMHYNSPKVLDDLGVSDRGARGHGLGFRRCRVGFWIRPDGDCIAASPASAREGIVAK